MNPAISIKPPKSPMTPQKRSPSPLDLDAPSKRPMLDLRSRLTSASLKRRRTWDWLETIKCGVRAGTVRALADVIVHAAYTAALSAYDEEGALMAEARELGLDYAPAHARPPTPPETGTCGLPVTRPTPLRSGLFTINSATVDLNARETPTNEAGRPMCSAQDQATRMWLMMSLTPTDYELIAVAMRHQGPAGRRRTAEKYAALATHATIRARLVHRRLAELDSSPAPADDDAARRALDFALLLCAVEVVEVPTQASLAALSRRLDGLCRKGRTQVFNRYTACEKAMHRRSGFAAALVELCGTTPADSLDAPSYPELPAPMNRSPVDVCPSLEYYRLPTPSEVWNITGGTGRAFAGAGAGPLSSAVAVSPLFAEKPRAPSESDPKI